MVRERQSQPLLAPEVLLLPRWERAKGRLGVLSGRGQMMCACIAKERGIRRGSVHNSFPSQVLERSRKLSKDEMVLRLGHGKAVAAEAMGSLSLVISNRMTRLRFRIRRLVDSKNLEIDDLDHLPTCESYLKGRMIQKPFVGQSTIAKGLLHLVHTDVCGPLYTPARVGFSYFITFIDDHTWYGYVYLMRYKSEAFGRFIGYSKDTTGYYFYDPTEQKIFVSRNTVFLKKDFPSNSRHDEVLIEKSSEEPQHDSTTSFEPSIHTDDVPVLRRSTRESRVPERYGFVGLTS
ncbi:UNVERIFIED_CONTAM: hypothetical protein Slati_2445100 [Sesamum latifolium]|uniref:Retroviral polymerase SH3-like domain-containing protein n=1 Tax=Sesamum latifolium TaxID=2727402 RepID=A0AAW2WFS3_9LAMI